MADVKGSSVRGRSSLTKVLVAAIVPLALFVSLVSWAFASPVGASPDDDYHMTSIWCGQGLREGLCEEGEKPSERRIPAVLLEAPGCYAYDANASASCPLPDSSVLVNSNRGNFEGGYPPVFYATMSIFAGEDVSKSILLMRTFNALLFVGIASALFFLTPASKRGPLLWGGLISVVPLGMFLIPSVNPSSWAVASAATLWFALLGYYKAAGKGRRIAFGSIAVLATVMGAGARSDGAVYSVLALAVVFILVSERSTRFVLLTILPAALFVLCVILFFSGRQSSVVDPNGFVGDPSTGHLLWLIRTNLLLLPELWVGALGTWGLGWLDTELPGSVWVGAIMVFGSVVFWGLRRMPVRKTIALAMVAFTLIVVPLYILVHDNVLVGAYVQPRYIYPLMVLFAGIALLHCASDDLGMSRFQLGTIAALLSIANAVAIYTNLRRYVTGVDAPQANLDNGVEWWWGIPVSPMGMLMIGSVAFGVALIGAAVYASSRGSTLQRDDRGVAAALPAPAGPHGAA